MAEVSGHISEHVMLSIFCNDINSILYTVTNIHPKNRILLKFSNMFCSENLALFKVTSIHSTRKCMKNRNSETQWKKAMENSRLEQIKRQKSSS